MIHADRPQHFRPCPLGELEIVDIIDDARRIRARGVDAVQIATGNACHLDAHMVHDALHRLDLSHLDILFIENVGNLVCPASFDLGQHRNVTLLSVPEGDDKPAKYPVMFRAADLVLLTKTDLLPYLKDFEPQRAQRYLRELAKETPLVSVVANDRSGIDAWLQWLRSEVSAQRDRLRAGTTLRPKVQPDGSRLHGSAETTAHGHASHHHHHHQHSTHTLRDT